MAGAISSALNDLHDILASYKRTQQAEAITRLINCQSSDASRFESLLTSDDLWRGLGAIWMVTLYESNTHTMEDVRNDERRFRDAIIRLVEAMVAEGIRNPEAEKVSKRLDAMNRFTNPAR